MKQKQLKSPEQALKEVREQLQLAIELEHSTIPPYLYAFWSMKDHGSDVCSSIYSVVKEEMLHMGLACNILNALGGDPSIASKKFIPDYPTALPAHDQTHDPFLVDLQKCGVESVVTFLHIELPRDLGLEEDEDPEVGTIGEFYGRIIDNIKLLSDEHFKHGRQAPQRFRPYHCGALIQINSRASALRAIKEILDQGEGLDSKTSDIEMEKTHYGRFLKIYKEMGGYGHIREHHFNTQELISSVDQKNYNEFQKGVNNVVSNPKLNNCNTVFCRDTNRRFNSAYSRMLDSLHDAFTSEEADLSKAVSEMLSLTRPALEIMSIPIDPEDLSKGYCGPTFEYLLKDERI